MMRERWYDIPGYEEIYQISSRGRARSLPRIDASGHRRNGTMLCAISSAVLRYRYYNLCKNGKVTMHCASALMARVLEIPNPRRCGYVIHIDGDADNFRRSNLCWVTLAEQRLRDGLKFDSPYYGVIRSKKKENRRYPWIVQLRHKQRRLVWRAYATPEEAAYAYDQEVLRRGLERPLNKIRRPVTFAPPEIKSLPGEVWRPFPGSRGTHNISNKGRVRRMNHISTTGRRRASMLRKITVSANGYGSILIRGRRYAISKVLARLFGHRSP